MKPWAEEYVRRLRVAAQLGPGGTAPYMPNFREAWYIRENTGNRRYAPTLSPEDRRFELSGEFE